MKSINVRLAVALFAIACASSSGCYVPSPVAHATLHIAADGTFKLNGKPVVVQDLAASVEAVEPESGNLVVQIEAAPTANVEAIRAAVAAVRSAHALIAFAKEAQGP
jgi:biopolymer transport protein ExbD